MGGGGGSYDYLKNKVINGGYVLKLFILIHIYEK